MNYSEKIITDIELHDVNGISECFNNGINPNSLFRGEPLINELTSEYTRSNRFKDCVKAFVDFGLNFDDGALLAVLLDDSEQLRAILNKDQTYVAKRYTMRCAYTPLLQVS